MADTEIGYRMSVTIESKLMRSSSTKLFCGRERRTRCYLCLNEILLLFDVEPIQVIRWPSTAQICIQYERPSRKNCELVHLASGIRLRDPYWAGREIACAGFLSRPVELVTGFESCQLEGNLNAIACYLNNVSVTDESVSITPELNRKAKGFLVHDERLFRRNKYGIRIVLHIGMRESILEGFHDEVAHWGFKLTHKFVRDCFWSSNMRPEFANSAKSCDACQKAKPANRKELAGKIPISRLFHTYCTTLRGRYFIPMPEINAWSSQSNKCRNGPVAWAVLTELFNSPGMMKFVKKEIIMAFGPPQYILSDNDSLDCKFVQDCAYRFNIPWKCTSTYNPLGIGIVDRIVGTLKKGLGSISWRCAIWVQA